MLYSLYMLSRPRRLYSMQDPQRILVQVSTSIPPPHFLYGHSSHRFYTHLLLPPLIRSQFYNLQFFLVYLVLGHTIHFGFQLQTAFSLLFGFRFHFWRGCRALRLFRGTLHIVVDCFRLYYLSVWFFFVQAAVAWRSVRDGVDGVVGWFRYSSLYVVHRVLVIWTHERFWHGYHFWCGF